MHFPDILESNISLTLYAFLLFIIATGLWQFIKSRYFLKEGETMRMRSLIPLGGAAATFGFIGLFMKYSEAFEAIEAAGDISPSIVASAMRHSFSYPVLGLLTLAITYVFRYVNQRMVIVVKT